MKKEKLSNRDVGFMEDALTVLINELHCEVHAIKSYFMTEDKTWQQVADESRRDRTELLELVSKKENSEIWCWNKHKLITIGGWIELANREYTKGNMKEADSYYDKAKKWLGIFLIINDPKGNKDD